MKKKLLVVVMAISLVATTLVGCGGNNTPKEKKENPLLSQLKEQVEDESYEDNIQSDKKEDKETENVVDNKPTKEEKDWSKAYDNYFDKYNFEDGLELASSLEEEGAKVAIKIGFATNGSYMKMNVKYKDNDPTSLEMYNIGDKVYTYMEMEGESIWTYAIAETQEEVEELMGSSGSISEDFDTKLFSTAKYDKEVKENGVVYDLLVYNDVDDTKGTFYINRETQEITKLVLDDGVESYDYTIKEIDKISLPAEAVNAEESTMEELSFAFVAVLLSAMGELDDESLNFETEEDFEFELDENDIEVNESTTIEDTKDENETTNNNVVEIDPSKMAFEDDFVVNGSTLTFGITKPADVEKLFGQKFYKSEENLELVINPNYYDSLHIDLGDTIVYAYFANFTDEAIALKDCTLYRFLLEADGYTSGGVIDNSISYNIGNVITPNITEDQLLKLLGEPNYTYNSDNYSLTKHQFDLPLGVSYFETEYELEVGFNPNGIYTVKYSMD